MQSYIPGDQHPVLSSAFPHADHVFRAIRGIASVLDALNPLRNRGSVSHPIETLLEEPEAMLAINSARTILHYLDAKLSTIPTLTRSVAS